MVRWGLREQVGEPLTFVEKEKLTFTEKEQKPRAVKVSKKKKKRKTKIRKNVLGLKKNKRMFGVGFYWG